MTALGCFDTTQAAFFLSGRTCFISFPMAEMKRPSSLCYDKEESKGNGHVFNSLTAKSLVRSLYPVNHEAQPFLMLSHTSIALSS